MRRTLGCIALVLTLATPGRASFTYDLMNYAADQDGATLSGYFTFRVNSGIVGTDDILDWSVTIAKQGVGSFTTGPSDPSAIFLAFDGIRLSATEMTLAAGAGGDGLIIESSNTNLTYTRSPDQYAGAAGNGGNLITWTSNGPSMGGTDPWVIARKLGTTAVPEPSSLGLCLCGIGTSFVVGARRFRRAS